MSIQKQFRKVPSNQALVNLGLKSLFALLFIYAGLVIWGMFL